MPAPVFPAPAGAVNPITGVSKQGKAPCFERYDPELKKARKTNDYVYKKVYNQACTQRPFHRGDNTKYDNIMGYTVVRRQNPNPNAVQVLILLPFV